MTDDSSNGSVTVVRDRRRDFGAHVVRIRVLSVPTSEQSPDGITCAFHYGRKGAAEPILRFDNHHGVHERHAGGEVAVIEFPGYEPLLDRFIDELPADHIP